METLRYVLMKGFAKPYNKEENHSTSKNLDISTIRAFRYKVSVENELREKKLLSRIQRKGNAIPRDFELLDFEKAAPYLQHNPFILTGYRPQLSIRACLRSVWKWHNESVNVWSHIVACVAFAYLIVYDLCCIDLPTSFSDKMVVAQLLLSFMVCMELSSAYHLMNCHSEEYCYRFLKLDLLGITFALLGIYISGIYYAFWCYRGWMHFYFCLAVAVFCIVVSVILRSDSEPGMELNEEEAEQRRWQFQSNKTIAFLVWAALGVVPVGHWIRLMGGYQIPIVQDLIGKIIRMYGIIACAFLIYRTRVPERFWPGKFDKVGSSHQIWHIMVAFALIYWHSIGVRYITYRVTNTCESTP